MTDITLWGATTVRTMRAVWMLEELGLSYHHRAIGPRTGETQTPDFSALNPKQKIPYLVDGDFGISESAAIVRYLAEKYGGNEGWPVTATPAERARLDEWCFFITGELDGTSLYVMRRHGDLADVYGAAPEVVAGAGVYFQKQLTAACEVLGEGFDFVLGDRFCVADLLLTTCLDWALVYKVAIPEEMHRYRSGIVERPAYSRAFRKNFGVAPEQIFGDN